MKKEKMSLEKMKSVLSNVLSRDEMKQVMAGSGNCGSCWYDGFIEPCFTGGANPGCHGCGWPYCP